MIEIITLILMITANVLLVVLGVGTITHKTTTYEPTTTSFGPLGTPLRLSKKEDYLSKKEEYISLKNNPITQSSENAQPEIHVDTYGNKIAITGQSYGDPVHTLLNPTTKTENIATLTQLETTPDNRPYPATNSRSEKPIERTLESHIIPSKIPTKPEDNSIKYDRTFLDVIKAIDAKKTPYKEQNREF